MKSYAPIILGDTSVELTGRNRIINGNFLINQRGYVSGASVGASAYAHDRWRNGAGSASNLYTFTQAVSSELQSTHSIDTIITIGSGSVLQQAIESSKIEGGTYTLSWLGTALGAMIYYDGSAYITLLPYGASGRSANIPPGVSVFVTFGAGTLTAVQLERGVIATPFERRPSQVELLLCYRYCQKFDRLIIAGYASGSGQPAYLSVLFKTLMRTSPTVTLTSAGTNNSSAASVNDVSFDHVELLSTSNNATPATFYAVCSALASAEI